MILFTNFEKLFSADKLAYLWLQLNFFLINIISYNCLFFVNNMASSHRRVGNNKNDNNKHNNNHSIFLLAAIFLIVLNLLSGSWSIQNNHQNILIHNYPNTDSEDDPIIVTNPKNSKYYRNDVNKDDVVVAKNDTDPIFAKYQVSSMSLLI